jgi:hypothetical protein
MPHDHTTQADKLIQDLLTSYSILNAHAANSGDLEAGWQLEEAFQAQKAHLVQLVAAALAQPPPG